MRTSMASTWSSPATIAAAAAAGSSCPGLPTGSSRMPTCRSWSPARPGTGESTHPARRHRRRSDLHRLMFQRVLLAWPSDAPPRRALEVARSLAETYAAELAVCCLVDRAALPVLIVPEEPAG